MTDLDLRPAFEAFLVEGRELVTELEQGLLRLEQGHDQNDAELINAMFRAAHTIKGSAGIVGIPSLGQFTHHVESLLDRVRDGEPLLDKPMVGRLLACCDHMGRLLELAEAGDVEGAAVVKAGLDLLAQLGAPAPRAAQPVQTVAKPASPDAEPGFRSWIVFSKDSLRDGLDPASALCFLSEHAPVAERCLLTQQIPTLEALNAEDCHLTLALHCESGTVQDARSAFEFFADDTVLVVCATGTSPADVHAALQPLREWLGDEALQAWRDAALITDAEWQIQPSSSLAPAAAEAVGKVAASGPGGTAAHAPRFVRVPAERLDELILQVGELVIAGASVDVLSREVRNPRLLEAVGQLAQLIDTIQSGTLQLRMVPIGESFNRFQRVVRDVSNELGKDIVLELVGGDTELDKAMVERIGDPLMHLVRNAMDHGLETPSDRQAQGKPAQGTLRLRAFHDSGNVVIEVSDDGRGLNRDRIVAKAIERGILSTGEGLSDSEAYQLIFEPGFSTAAQVTSLSGRGVGMDVVKKSVEALRGSITLHSQLGQGTLVQLRLPLTLAIIDGFMVGVSHARFILPLDLVIECIELPDDALNPDSPCYLNLRGEVLPFVSLRQAFSIPGTPTKRPSVVVVRSGEMKTGVLVDTLHGEIQTVIKPMSRIFQHLKAVSGTSILGSGDIALILDIHQLIQRSVDRTTRAAAAAVATL